MAELSRRHFLKCSAASLAMLAGFHPWNTSLNTELISQAYARDTASGGREFLALCDGLSEDAYPPDGELFTSPGTIKALEVQSGNMSAVDIPFFGHMPIQNPQHPRQVVAFEKWGKRGVLVDIIDQRVLATADAVEGNVFFGHAAFSSDGSTLVTTEDHFKGSSGQIVLRNASSLKPIQAMSSYGLRPHQCCATSDGKTLLVVNSGMKDDGKAAGQNGSTPSNITWIDFETGKQIHQIALNESAEVHYGHCDIAFDDWICVGGKKKLSSKEAHSDLVKFISPEGRIFIPAIPDDVKSRMKGEALSATFLGRSGLAAVTLPIGHMVLIFDYKKQVLVDAVTIKRPLGVVPDVSPVARERGCIVNSQADGDLISIVSGEGGNSTIRVADATFGGNGSHLTRMYI